MLSRLKILLIPTVALVLGAGMVIGRISTKLPATSQPTTQPGRWFDEQLNLSADQRKQMEAIWGDVRQNMGKTFEGREAISKERDAAVQALLTPEQKIAYDKIYETYRAKRDEMDKQREKLFADANQRSRAILTPEQQKQWDALSQEHRGWGGPRRGGPRGPGAPGGPGGPGSQPSTTQPSKPSTRPTGSDWPGF